MKKLILTTAALLAALTMYGQGTYSGVVNYNSAGSTGGSRISVCPEGVHQTALFWGPAGTTDAAALMQVGGNVNILTGPAAGTFFGAGRTITYTSPAANGAVVALQSRAWRVDPGVTGWDNAIYKGWGPIFDMKLKDPNNAMEVVPTITEAAGWRGYVVPCPEPSAIVLGLLGAGALLMLRRRK